MRLIRLIRRGAIVSLIAVASATSCSNFEDPTIVIDLRPLAVVAEPPEVLVDIDLEADDIIASVEFDDLVDVRFCALVADPLVDRSLHYRFTACEPTRSFRCDEPDADDDISISFGEGSIADPETGQSLEEMCATLLATPVLETLLIELVQEDPRRLVEGADVQIELRVETDGPNPEVVYTRKSARYAARLPANRAVNNNPTLDGFTVVRDDDSESELPLGRCADIEPLILSPGEHIVVDPIVPEGTAELYIQLDLELNPVASEEALVYNWAATAGDWRAFATGGATDPFGNVPLARNEFTAPQAGDVEGDIELWITQREERLGGAWFRSCVRVQ